MPTLTATEARSKLYQLIDESASTHEPVLITGKRTNAVLLSEEDRKGLKTPVKKCSDRPGW
jgi:prevent-host-death family protein